MKLTLTLTPEQTAALEALPENEREKADKFFEKIDTLTDRLGAMLERSAPIGYEPLDDEIAYYIETTPVVRSNTADSLPDDVSKMPTYEAADKACTAIREAVGLTPIMVQADPHSTVDWADPDQDRWVIFVQMEAVQEEVQPFGIETAEPATVDTIKRTYVCRRAKTRRPVGSVVIVGKKAAQRVCDHLNGSQS